MLDSGRKMDALVTYKFYQSCNSLPIHEKLTEQHLHLDPALRMRNHLAEDILDDKMLCLMKVSICVYENKKTNLSSMTFLNLILCSKGLYGGSTLPLYHFTSYLKILKCTNCTVHITKVYTHTETFKVWSGQIEDDWYFLLAVFQPQWKLWNVISVRRTLQKT